MGLEVHLQDQELRRLATQQSECSYTRELHVLNKLHYFKLHVLQLKLLKNAMVW